MHVLAFSQTFNHLITDHGTSNRYIFVYCVFLHLSFCPPKFLCTHFYFTFSLSSDKVFFFVYKTSLVSQPLPLVTTGYHRLKTPASGNPRLQLGPLRGGRVLLQEDLADKKLWLGWNWTGHLSIEK